MWNLKNANYGHDIKNAKVRNANFEAFMSFNSAFFCSARIKNNQLKEFERK